MQELVKGDRIFVSGTTKQRLMFFGRVTCMPSIEQTTFERVVDAGYFHHGGVKYDLVLVLGMMPGMQLAPLPINIAWNARVIGSGSEEEPTAIPHTVHYNVSATNRAMDVRLGTEGGVPEVIMMIIIIIINIIIIRIKIIIFIIIIVISFIIIKGIIIIIIFMILIIIMIIRWWTGKTQCWRWMETSCIASP